MELELHQLDRRYEALRKRDPRKERHVLASLAERGQLLPVIVDGQAAGYFADEKRRNHVQSVLVADLDAGVAVIHDSLAISRATKMTNAAHTQTHPIGLRCIPDSLLRFIVVSAHTDERHRHQRRSSG